MNTIVFPKCFGTMLFIYFLSMLKLILKIQNYFRLILILIEFHYKYFTAKKRAADIIIYDLKKILFRL